jgi:hypothetical protein
MGHPFMANPQSAVFYPFHLIFLVMDSVWAMKLSIVFHIFMSGILMFQLSRHLRLTFYPSVFVSIAWMFNTHLMVHMEFHSSLTCITWMPLAVLLAIKITETVLNHLNDSILHIFRYIVKPLFFLIMTLVVQFLAGNPQPLIFTLLMICSYMIITALTQKNIRFLGIQVLIICVVGIFSIGIVMPQLILTWELIPLSIRGHKIDPDLISGSVHPFHLITLLLPFFWGGPGYFHQWLGKDWSLIEYWLGACYIGIPTLIMITLSGLFFIRKKSDNHIRPLNPLLFFWLMGSFGLILAFGHYTPIYMLFYHIVPLFDRLRWPGNALCIPVFCFSIVAGYGFHWILNNFQHKSDKQHIWANRIIALWLCLLIIAVVLYFQADKSHFLSVWKNCCDEHHILENQRISDMGLFILYLSFSLTLCLIIRIPQIKHFSAVLIICLLFMNFYQVSSRLIVYTDDNQYRYRPQKKIQSLKDKTQNFRVHTTYGATQQWLYGINAPEKFQWAMNASVGDTWLPYHIRKTWGGGSLRLMSVSKIYALLDNVSPETLRRLADLLNIGYVIHGAPLAEVLTSQTPNNVNFTQRKTALPRAFFVSDFQIKDNWVSALTLMISETFDPVHQAVIVSKQKEMVSLSEKKQNVNQVIHIQDNWNQTDLRVETPESGLLVFNDPWFPGWHVWVDGKEHPLYLVNAIFRGVFVQPGSQHIRFVYQPEGLYDAIFVSIIFFMLFLFFWALLKKTV